MIYKNNNDISFYFICLMMQSLNVWKKLYYKQNKEYLLPVKLKSKYGSISNLKGLYIKNSPRPDLNCSHPFDGTGYISKYYFSNNEIHYSSKIVNIEQNKNNSGIFGPYNFPLSLNIKNASNTNVLMWNNEFISFYEGGSPYSIDYNNYYLDFKDGLPFTTKNELIDKTLRDIGILGDAVCAHPKINNEHLILCSIKYDLFNRSHILFYVLDKLNNLIITHTIKLDSFIYFHDFLVTDNFIIFHQHEYNIDLKSITNKGIANALSSKDTLSSNIYILDRSINQYHTIKIEGNPFITHFISAKEDEDNKSLNIQFIQYHKYFIPGNSIDFHLKHPGSIRDISINLSANTINDDSKLNIWIEFPIFDDISNTSFSTFGNIHPQEGICQLNNDRLEQYWIPINSMFSEPFIIEDKYIGTLCYDIKDDETTLQFFKKYKLAEGPIAIYELPEKIMSLGLHGNYYSIK